MTQRAAIAAGAVGLGLLAFWAYSRSIKAAVEQGDTGSTWASDSLDIFNDYTTTNPGETSIADVISNPLETIAESIDRMTGSTFKISRMAQVTPALLAEPNIKAALRMIRRGEGTADDAGYRRIFGGRMFDSYTDHPRVKVTAGGYVSTAAGAYQFLASTWDETAKILGLRDFSPDSQDLAAVARIVYRKALDDVLAGDMVAALPKLGKEWASMPGSPYGQPTISQQTALNTFKDFGGYLA